MIVETAQRNLDEEAMQISCSFTGRSTQERSAVAKILRTASGNQDAEHTLCDRLAYTVKKYAVLLIQVNDLI